MPRKTGKRTSTTDVLPVDSNDIVPAGPLAGGLDAADGALLADLAGQTAARWAKADAEATELKFGTVDVEPPEILDGPSVPEITHPAVEEPADQAKPAEIPPEPERNSPPEWVIQAQEAAADWLTGRHAAGCYPSQRDTANWVARVLHDKGVLTSTGKRISSEYIRRYALNKWSLPNGAGVAQMEQEIQPRAACAK